MPRDSAPFGTARLVGNRLLSGPGSAKEVRRFTLDTRDSPVPLTYETGDALAVHPVNSPALVAEWLAVTGADPDAPVSVEGIGPVTFREALHRHLDITRITPGLLRFVAERADGRGDGGDGGRRPGHGPGREGGRGGGHEREASHGLALDREGSHGLAGDREGGRFLRKLLRPDNTDELARWSWGRQAVDLVAAYPVTAGAEAWAGVLRRLRPRLYSISTSPLTDPYLIGLTVSVVRYEGPGGRPRAGVCSSFLAGAGPGAEIAVRVRRSPRFRPPAGPGVPMVMIGAGTGVAPFLGFLAERRALGHTGPNWLFFGERHRASDFYVERELADLRADGTLTRLDTAFSRDQRAKVYVQDRMRERGPLLWSWLQDGAHVYVCGDAARMAEDVDRALREVAARHGGLSPDAAAAYVERLAADRRYARDVY